MKKIVTILCLILLICVLLAGGLFGYLTIAEYRPEAETALEIRPGNTHKAVTGEPIRVISWNIGYGALGEAADFFMDGGSMVQTADKETVYNNLENIRQQIQSLSPDLVLLQECDLSSARSYRIDETAYLSDHMDNYAATFAPNFRVPFVPYPLPPIGKVDSGLLTLSSFDISEAFRLSLPCPFKWPVRIANLKRCLSVSRMPLENDPHELVLVNLHLEAYDSGEGKEAQTKMLMDFLRKEAEAGNYVIAGGDLNQTFSNCKAFPILESMWAPGLIDVESYADHWQFLMDETVPSCRSLDQPYTGAADPESFQFYLIDGFIVSDNVEVKTCQTQDLNFVYSDHNPVLLEAVCKGDGSVS